MAETVNRGPTVSVGSLMDGRVEAFDGPSLEYQGVVVLDPRYSPAAKDGLSPGRIKGFYTSPTFIVVDSIPSTTTTTAIAAAQAPSTTQGVKLNLTTAVLGTAAGVPVWTPGVPIIASNTTVVATASVIDFGFTTGTTVANSSTVALLDNTLVATGQWLVIGGGQATNSALICQVLTINTTNGTTITITPVAGTGGSHLPIGQGNLYSQFLPPGTQFGPAAASASATEPYRAVGLSKVFDPRQGVCRALAGAAASIGSGTGTFLVTGFDIYGVPMTELITLNGTTLTNGQKAWKYISSIATQTTATSGTPANVSFGAGDLVGINMRSDKWEYLDIFFNGGFAIQNTGWTSAITATATNTTGDIRGTQNCSTISVGTGVAGGGFNGVKRLTITQSVEQLSMANANPVNFTSWFGVTQA